MKMTKVCSGCGGLFMTHHNVVCCSQVCRWAHWRREHLIAATAHRYGLHVMTRNVDDFSATGVLLLNPWDSPNG